MSSLVSLIDLPPTLLDAVSLSVPPEMQGRSLLPLIQGQAEDWPEEIFVQISEAEVGRAIRTHRWKYGVYAPEKNGWQDPGSDCYTEEHLYDLAADPYELTDLIGLDTYRAAADDLRDRLILRMTEAGESPPTITPALPRPSGQRQPELALLQEGKKGV